MEVLPLGKPFTVLIEPSSLCNFRCVQCFQSLKTDSYFSDNRMNMPMARFCRVIEQLQAWQGPKLKVLKLSLYGEPLLNPCFSDMLSVAREADIAERIETTTNASLLTKTIAEKLVEYQLDYVRVSIYSPYQKKHESITGTAIDIRRIHDNLKALQFIKKRVNSQRPFVAVKMLDTYGPENDDFSKMYEDVSDEMYIDKPHNWIRMGQEKFTDVLYRNEAAKADADMLAGAKPRRACPMGFTTMAVRSNGDVSPCCVDFIGGTNLGNADHSTLREIWESPAWRNFWIMQLEGRKQENSSCAHCDFYLSNHYTKDDIDGFDTAKLRMPKASGKQDLPGR